MHYKFLFYNKTTLNKLKKEFIQKATECETKIYEAKKASMYPTLPPEQVAKLEHLGSEYLTNTAIYEDRYIQQLNETNKTRETEQKDLFQKMKMENEKILLEQKQKEKKTFLKIRKLVSSIKILKHIII